MDNTKLRSTIDNILKQDDRLWNKDKTELNQTLLLDKVEDVDEKIIELLLHDKQTREEFFVKIKEVYIFKINNFRFFMEENKVNNSYTKYKNRIGLTDGKRFLNDSKDVVLNFPYKDCVLEGGQSTEEGMDTFFNYEAEKTKTIKGEKLTEPAGYKEKQSKRKEIFFNEVLAHDEIDRLYDEKVLVNWKRFTKDGEQEVKEIKRDEYGTIKENLIIKGNNLLTLHSLKKQFAGKVKLIYIDPPYNTGNDEFKYNDNFNHSTWLTFIKNRLEIAKEFLSEDGSIFISIDNSEISYLMILMDEIFGRENRKNIIAVKRSSVSGAKVINPGVVNILDFLVVYAKNSNIWKPKKIFRAKDRDKRYNNFITNYSDHSSKWNFCSVLDAFSEYKQIKKNKLKKILKDDFEHELEEFIYSNAEKVIQFVFLDDNSISDAAVKLKYQSKKDPSKVYILEREGKANYYLYKGKAILFVRDRLIKIGDKYYFGELISDIWADVLPNDIHNEGGVKMRRGKKPEKLLQRIIELITNRGDRVMDFYLGTGTTCAVAHKIGRRYIGIEQLNYGKNDPLVRLNNVIKNKDRSGISKEVKWQGGGNFIYFELAKWNEKAKEKILACKKLQELEDLFDTLYEKYFLNYNLKIKEFKEKVIKEDNFKKLSLDEQKKMFLSMLDLNQMYVQKTEMADKRFNINNNDQKLTEEFYNFRG